MVNTIAIIQFLVCTLLSSWSLSVDNFASNDDGRIINGDDVNYGDFKFVISLRAIPERAHVCGGTIITKNWVLTAAHCCELPRHLYSVYYGSVNRDTGGSVRMATRVIAHEKFAWDMDDDNNDICLIRVFPPFIFGEKARQVILPPRTFRFPAGSTLVAAGWGFNTPIVPEQKTPQRMRKVDLVAAEVEQCWNGTMVKEQAGLICTFGSRSGQGICQGDSGGPLLKDNVQVGITSFLKAECGSSVPEFFTNVSHYIDWIKEKLGREAYQLRFST